MKIDNFLQFSALFSAYHLHNSFFLPMQETLEKEGVTFIQAMILTGLFFEDEPAGPRQLTGSLKISSSNLSHTLKELIHNSYLKREMNRDDARQVGLVLTAKGRKKTLRLIKILDDMQEGLENHLGEKKLDQWNRQAHRLIEFALTFRIR